MSTFVRARRVMSLLLAMLSLTAIAAKGRPRRPLIIAHRGASHDAPENTLAAFHLAWRQDADGIEGDFYLSADGQIVCIHDATTERTSDKNLRVDQSTLEELRALDVGSWKSPENAGERIATLEEVLQTVPPGKLIYIEIKCGPEITQPLVDVLARQRYVTPDQIRIIAFNADVITSVKRALPHIKAYWLTGYRENSPPPTETDLDQSARQQPKVQRSWSPTHTEVLDTLIRTGADGLGSNGNMEVVTADFAAALAHAGKQLHVWTIDDTERAEYFSSIGAHSITSNVPVVMRRIWPANDPARGQDSIARASMAQESFPQAGFACNCRGSRRLTPRRHCGPRIRLFPRLLGRRR